MHRDQTFEASSFWQVCCLIMKMILTADLPASPDHFVYMLHLSKLDLDVHQKIGEWTTCLKSGAT